MLNESAAHWAKGPANQTSAKMQSLIHQAMLGYITILWNWMRCNGRYDLTEEYLDLLWSLYTSNGSSTKVTAVPRGSFMERPPK